MYMTTLELAATDAITFMYLFDISTERTQGYHQIVVRTLQQTRDAGEYELFPGLHTGPCQQEAEGGAARAAIHGVWAIAEQLEHHPCIVTIAEVGHQGKITEQ